MEIDLCVYPYLKNIYETNIDAKDDLSHIVILTSNNDDVRLLNSKILQLINTPSIIFYNIDYAKPRGHDQNGTDIELD